MKDEISQQFINGLGELKQSLDANTLQLKTIQHKVDQLCKFTEEENYAYLNDLLYPEKRPGCKIPSRVPVPSTTFQLKSVGTYSTNNKGNILFRINPWFLAEESAVGKYFPVINPVNGNKYWGFVCPPMTSVSFSDYDMLDGVNQMPQSEIAFKTSDMGQIVPSGLYASYRIVSASAKAKYIGPIERVSGICGGGITNQPLLGQAMRCYYVSRNTTPVYDPSRSSNNDYMYGHEFTDFNNINHLVYSHTGPAIEGIRMLYFPLDNKFEEFTKIFKGDVNSYNAGPGYPYINFAIDPKDGRNSFWWLIYFQGLPVSTQCVRLELTINYELMPAEKYLNYMPINIQPIYIDSKTKKKILHKVASQAVTKNKDDDELNK